MGAPLAAASLAAWALIAVHPLGMAVPALCAGHDVSTIAAMIRSMSTVPDLLAVAVTLNPPASVATGWGLMLVAMMSPLLAEPLLHVRRRSLRARQARSTLIFLVAYLSVWFAAGAILLVVAFTAQLCLGPTALPAILAIAAIWQVSPAKQVCLNRCHSSPTLSAFGPAGDQDVFGYGFTQALWCVGTCWSLMLVPLLVEGWHVLTMMFGTMWALAERVERPTRPSWRLRWPRKATRAAHWFVSSSISRSNP